MSYNSASEAELSPLIIQTSNPYITQWNRLVSTTNWEKGCIIVKWRQALKEAGAPVADYTDELWSRQVGGVTPQHVGRLRRVFERFAGVYQQYEGLYWSHFHCAMEWPDAEMWLEGAVNNNWSITRMRQNRWEAMGAPEDLKPSESDIFAAQVEEEIDQADDNGFTDTIFETRGEVRNTADNIDEEMNDSPLDDIATDLTDASAYNAQGAASFRPFEKLSALPADLNEAFELFKLAIIKHKRSDWQEIAQQEVLAALDALKKFALSPAE